MSQTNLTPRNIYGPRSSRDSGDSYSFPVTHSSNSSLSSASNYPYFGGSATGSVTGSVDSSVTDYSSTTPESHEPMQSRTLPRPSNLLGASLPRGTQSMMGQFSSQVSSNIQKKHKCKICDKRFTRPSSLHTHMYSHTGEKRKFMPYHYTCKLLTQPQHMLATSKAVAFSFLLFRTFVDTTRFIRASETPALRICRR